MYICQNCHLTFNRQSHLIDPQFSYDDVVHCGGNFLPCVVIVALFKDCVNRAYKERVDSRTK